MSLPQDIFVQFVTDALDFVKNERRDRKLKHRVEQMSDAEWADWRNKRLPEIRINLDDSGCRRGLLLIVLCRFSAVVAGWRVAVLPDVLGAAPTPTAPGGLLPGRGDGVAGQAGAGRADSRCQQARNASFQGQVRLIFSTRARAWRTSRAGRLNSR